MKSNLAVLGPYDEEDVSVLVSTLHRTQQRLREVAGRGVDAVTLPDGNVYFLLEAQESLRRTDITERKKMEEQYFRAQRLESIGTPASGLSHDLTLVA